MNKKQKLHKTIKPGNALAVTVLGPEREDVAYALKVWKRKVKNSNILEAVKDRKTFTKPSVKRRDQLTNAKYIQKIRDMHNS